MKPRLTTRVLDGLGHLAGLVEAGGSEEITGYDEEQMARMKDGDSTRQHWNDVLAACRWIRAMQDHRAPS